MGGGLRVTGLDELFDYDGALSRARRLYALGDEVQAGCGARQKLASFARTDFVGPFADQFASRMGVEEANMSAVAAGLRNDALDLATLWQQAMDNENHIRYARHVAHLKTQRSEAQQVWDHFFGWHYPPEPDRPPLPQPPLFAPTATLVPYSVGCTAS